MKIMGNDSFPFYFETVNHVQLKDESGKGKSESKGTQIFRYNKLLFNTGRNVLLVNLLFTLIILIYYISVM
jgi:hypothetical protein